jgi:hypothetical protein
MPQCFLDSHAHSVCLALPSFASLSRQRPRIHNYDRVSMAEKPPKSHLSPTRSAFSLIDPSTSLFHRQIDRHAYLTSGFRTHVAISYVWSEWRDNASDKLPSWPALQKRLMSVLGEHASPEIKAVTGKATRCWLDCMCIDQESREDKSYWIPRMDEIYYEARCTILLLRVPGLDLSPVLELKRRMYYPLSGPLKLRDIVQRFRTAGFCASHARRCSSLTPSSRRLRSMR